MAFALEPLIADYAPTLLAQYAPGLANNLSASNLPASASSLLSVFESVSFAILAVGFIIVLGALVFAIVFGLTLFNQLAKVSAVLESTFAALSTQFNDLVVFAFDNLGSLSRTLLDAILSIESFVLGVFADIPQFLNNYVFGLTATLGTRVSTIITQLQSFLQQGAATLTATVTNFIQLAGELVTYIIQQVFGVLPEVAATILSYFTLMINTVFSWLIGAISFIESIVNDILEIVEHLLAAPAPQAASPAARITALNTALSALNFHYCS